jgi:pilus assembly protein CpaE
VGQQAILVAGAKGGVGTSTVALNLSVQIAQTTRKRVVLLDYARPFGQISLMLSIDPRFTLLDALGRIDRLDENLFASLVTKHKAGVAVLAGALHAPLRQEQRQSVTIEALARLIGIAANAFDYVVVDMGFVNGAEWAPVLREAGSIALVTEPSELAMGMLGRYLDAAEAAGLDPQKFEIVINRWRQNDQDAWKDIERELKRPIVSRLPNDYRQLTEAVKMGMPLMASSNNPLIARYRDLAAHLTTPVERAGRIPIPASDNAPASVK